MYGAIEYMSVTKFDLLATAVDSGEVVESAGAVAQLFYITVFVFGSCWYLIAVSLDISNTDSVFQHASISHSLIIREGLFYIKW